MQDRRKFPPEPEPSRDPWVLRLQAQALRRAWLAGQTRTLAARAPGGWLTVVSWLAGGRRGGRLAGVGPRPRGPQPQSPQPQSPQPLPTRSGATACPC